MIHHFFIIDHNNEIVVQKQFWSVDFNKNVVFLFAQEVRNAEKVISMQIEHHKYVGKPLLLAKHKGVVILCAEALDDNEVLHKKVEQVVKEYRRVLEKEIDAEAFMAQLTRSVTIPLRITVIGYSDVGKDDILTILNGGIPPPNYISIENIDIQEIEGAQMGTYGVIGLDLSPSDRFRNLWELYFKKSRIIILVTDSTLENVLNSKDIVDFIHRQNVTTPVFTIANKQDLPGALSAALVQRILAIPVYGTVAIPKEKEKLLDIIWSTLYQEVPKDKRPPRPPIKERKMKRRQQEEKPRKRESLVKILDHTETEEYRLSIRNKAVNEAFLQELQNWAEEYSYFLPPDAAKFLGFGGPYFGPWGRMTCAPIELSSLIPSGLNYILVEWRTLGSAISVIIRVFGKDMVDNSIIFAERVERNIPSKLPPNFVLSEVKVITH